MCKLDHKEGWVLKNWCFWIVVLEKTLESPLDSKEIQPVYPKGNQSWIFIGRTDVEAETPILWPPDVKNWLIGKDPYAGKDWRREEKGWRNDRGWDGWMASLTWWTWVWVNSRSWWRTGKSGVLQSMGSQSRTQLNNSFVYKLNKQGDNIQTWCIPFPIWNKSIVLCLVLTVSSFPAYRFLRRLVR